MTIEDELAAATTRAVAAEAEVARLRGEDTRLRMMLNRARRDAARLDSKRKDELLRAFKMEGTTDWGVIVGLAQSYAAGPKWAVDKALAAEAHSAAMARELAGVREPSARLSAALGQCLLLVPSTGAMRLVDNTHATEAFEALLALRHALTPTPTAGEETGS